MVGTVGNLAVLRVDVTRITITRWLCRDSLVGRGSIFRRGSWRVMTSGVNGTGEIQNSASSAHPALRTPKNCVPQSCDLPEDHTSKPCTHCSLCEQQLRRNWLRQLTSIGAAADLHAAECGMSIAPQVSNMASEKFTVAVIGAGFSGICSAIKLKEKFGDDVNLIVFEKAAGVGGTWYLAGELESVSDEIGRRFTAVRL